MILAVYLAAANLGLQSRFYLARSQDEDRLIVLDHARLGKETDRHGRIRPFAGTIRDFLPAGYRGRVVLDIEPVPTPFSPGEASERDFWSRVKEARAIVRKIAPDCELGLYGTPQADIPSLHNLFVASTLPDHPDHKWYTGHTPEFEAKQGAWAELERRRIQANRYALVDFVAPRLYAVEKYKASRWLPSALEQYATWSGETGIEVVPFIWSRIQDGDERDYLTRSERADYASALATSDFDYIVWRASTEKGSRPERERRRLIDAIQSARD
jgi:hypothetical protein